MTAGVDNLETGIKLMDKVGNVVPMAAQASNFLVPNATFVVELIAFAIILWVLGKYVVPPINKAMTDRQDDDPQAVRGPRARPRPTRGRPRRSFKAQMTEARHEAAKIREEAREQGAAIIADMRKQAQEESDRILKHARAQLDAERQQAVAAAAHRGRHAWPPSSPSASSASR